MKIRNKQLVRFAGRAGSLAMRGLVKTLRFQKHDFAGPVEPQGIPDSTTRVIYSIWHENLLLPTVAFGDESLAVLISKHADGQILGSLIESMGMTMVQGSTNRGGVEAVRKLLDPAASRRNLAVTPDGPRGPRRVVQPGIAYIASRTGMAVACIGVGYCNPWRARRWDRFAVPKPCTRAKLVTGGLIRVPAGLKSHELEAWRLRIQEQMDELNAIAETWAATNRLTPRREAATAPSRHRAAA